MSQLLKQPPEPGCFWNVNLPWPTDVPATQPNGIPELVFCEPSRDPLPLRYEKQTERQAERISSASTSIRDESLSDEHYCYAGRYGDRIAATGSDVAVCFSGGIAITHLCA